MARNSDPLAERSWNGKTILGRLVVLFEQGHFRTKTLDHLQKKPIFIGLHNYNTILHKFRAII